jgi:hypothetical protein
MEERSRERNLLYRRQEDRIQDAKYLYNRSFIPQREEVLARTKMLDSVGAFTKMHLLEWNFTFERIAFSKNMKEANRLDSCEFSRKEILYDEWKNSNMCHQLSFNSFLDRTVKIYDEYLNIVDRRGISLKSFLERKLNETAFVEPEYCELKPASKGTKTTGLYIEMSELKSVCI